MVYSGCDKKVKTMPSRQREPTEREIQKKRERERKATATVTAPLTIVISTMRQRQATRLKRIFTNRIYSLPYACIHTNQPNKQTNKKIRSHNQNSQLTHNNNVSCQLERKEERKK